MVEQWKRLSKDTGRSWKFSKPQVAKILSSPMAPAVWLFKGRWDYVTLQARCIELFYDVFCDTSWEIVNLVCLLQGKKEPS